MSGKSFYDLDYMIEINEQRLEQYTIACDKVSERLTYIIVIYSAMAIFWVPVVTEIFDGGVKDWWLNSCFVLYAVLFAISVCYTVRLMIPAKMALLKAPKMFYKDCRREYESAKNNRMSVENLLKASYIKQLENCVDTNIAIYNKKAGLYQNALITVLLSVVPYLFCVGYHISNQEISKKQKTEIVKTEKV